MTTNYKIIEEGINYLKIMRRTNQNTRELAEDLEIPEEQVKDAIKAARAHKDAAEKVPEVTFIQPPVKVHYDLMTKARQVISNIEVELLREIIVKYGEEPITEFTTFLPVKITIKRK